MKLKVLYLVEKREGCKERGGESTSDVYKRLRLFVPLSFGV